MNIGYSITIDRTKRQIIVSGGDEEVMMELPSVPGDLSERDLLAQMTEPQLFCARQQRALETAALAGFAAEGRGVVTLAEPKFATSQVTRKLGYATLAAVQDAPPAPQILNGIKSYLPDQKYWVVVFDPDSSHPQPRRTFMSYSVSLPRLATTLPPANARWEDIVLVNSWPAAVRYLAEQGPGITVAYVRPSGVAVGFDYLSRSKWSKAHQRFIAITRGAETRARVASYDPHKEFLVAAVPAVDHKKTVTEGVRLSMPIEGLSAAWAAAMLAAHQRNETLGPARNPLANQMTSSGGPGRNN